MEELKNISIRGRMAYLINNALQNQATLDNIFINTKYFKDGKYALPCRNCQVTFEGCLFPKQ